MATKLSTRQRKFIRRKTKVEDLDPSETDEELNIVPFLDIVVNLIMFLLMSIATIAFFAQVEASLPQLGQTRGARGAEDRERLDLHVFLVDEGIIVSGAGGKLAPGCRNTMPGRVITIPKARGAYDWEALAECAQRVKAEFEDETVVTLAPDPQVEFQSMISAMDALRGTEEEPLFPDVQPSVGVQ